MPEARFRHGLVLGKFYPLHSGHSNLIREATRRCHSVTVEVLGATGESIPLEVRADWVREEHPTVTVASALDDAPVDYESDEAWDAHMAVFVSLLDSPVDAVFSSDDYGQELAARLGAQWVQVDPGRTLNPVSGTSVRNDVSAYWGELAPAVRAWLTPRVVVIGAESTGTTTLAEALAEAYSTSWVAEYGRLYTELRPGGIDAPWRPDEFALIADRQLEWERAAARRVSRPLLFCDTDLLTTAIWQNHFVPGSARALHDRAAEHPPSLYILTADDIPYVDDYARLNEGVRTTMHQTFRDTLARQTAPWIEVTGTVAERLVQASEVIDRMLVQTGSVRPTDAVTPSLTVVPTGLTAR